MSPPVLFFNSATLVTPTTRRRLFLDVLMTTASPSRDARLILAAVCLASITLPLSFSGGAVATPAIGARFLVAGDDPATLSWITNAFMLTFGSLLMAAGALADAYGRKRVFTAGLALYVLSSLALCVAPSLLAIDLLRGVQGMAAAATLAGGTAAMAQVFDGAARTRAFSFLGTSFGVGLAFGPVLAGALIEHAGWPAVFLAQALIGAVAFLFGPPRMRESRDPDARGVDWPGTFSFSASLAAFTYALIGAPGWGWTAFNTLAWLAASVTMLAVFIVVELRSPRPMLDLSLFRYARFAGVQLLPVGTCYCFVVLLILLPLRFIGIDGLSAAQAGVLMLALSLPMLVMPSLAATLARSMSPGSLSAVGLLIAASGLCWLAQASASASAWAMAPAMLLIGAGTGLPWGLMDGLSVSVVPKERAGMASGIFSTSRVAGEGIALAVVTAVLAALVSASMQATLPSDLSTTAVADASRYLGHGDLAHAAGILPQAARLSLQQAYAAAFRQLLYVLAVITVLCALLTWILLREPADDAVATGHQERA